MSLVPVVPELGTIQSFITIPICDLQDRDGNIDAIKLISELTLHPKIMTEKNANNYIEKLKSTGLLTENRKGLLRIT